MKAARCAGYSEVRPGGIKLIYQHKYSVAEMLAVYKLQSVECEIEQLRQEVNRLLDMRNCSQQEAVIKEVDERLLQRRPTGCSDWKHK